MEMKERDEKTANMIAAAAAAAATTAVEIAPAVDAAARLQWQRDWQARHEQRQHRSLKEKGMSKKLEKE